MGLILCEQCGVLYNEKSNHEQTCNSDKLALKCLDNKVKELEGKIKELEKIIEQLQSKTKNLDNRTADLDQRTMGSIKIGGGRWPK